jgi:hypothetical protein
VSDDVPVELCFSDLAASTAGVLSVAPDDSVERAVTIMALKEFSQLPVLSGPRDLKGIFSWKSLGEARLRGVPSEVRECLAQPKVVAIGSPVLPALPLISAEDFVLVQDYDRTICGIVTAADITLEFGWLARPFLLLGEVERRLRHLLGRAGEPSRIFAGDATYEGEIPARFEELTLGELERAFERPEVWNQLQVDLDRGEFLKALSAVRELRNEMVHFRGDQPDRQRLQALESFARLLRLVGA